MDCIILLLTESEVSAGIYCLLCFSHYLQKGDQSADQALWPLPMNPLDLFHHMTSSTNQFVTFLIH